MAPGSIMIDSEKLRVGIIGLGHWGPNVVRNFAAHPRCSVRYVCDLRTEAFRHVENLIPKECKKVSNSEELIRSSELDAVVVATSSSTHYELVKMALESGK